MPLKQLKDSQSKVRCFLSGLRATHSSATCHLVISIFKSALEDKSLIEEAKQSSAILGKCSHPGDLVSAKNGWDAVKVTKSLLSTEPKMNPTTKQRNGLMKKSHKKHKGA